ncbi:hypothetical protein C5167_034551 [Papaver somniferum]|uniref:Replication protein A OB domain-containing protein n=1 Tax=Papaver somniferum TaxID=3469 RepID=A0A4Y7KDB2_PAPSO|nr:replication protein A 70 kDa DNA-binding subunit A-like [Papaver somniferum]RZC71374.1 hypothetical protein C5167_034551 [Papaver somniferum]
MDIILTPDAILDIRGGDTKSRPIVQVLDIKSVRKSPVRYQFVVSDSVSTLQAALDVQLNDKVTKGYVREGSVVQLIEYFYKNHKNIFIMNMRTVIPECVKIGDPKPLGEPHLKYQSAPSGCNAFAPTGNISKTSIFDSTVKPACQPPSLNFITRGSLAKNEVPINPISALGSHLGEWTLKARVTAKGGIQYHRLVEGDVKVISFDLLDSSGGEIQVKYVGCAVVNRFYPYVEVGKVYMVSKGSLKQVPKDYNHLKNEWVIILKATSMLEKCEEDCSIPQQQFLFTPISEIKNVENNSILDVIGIVTNVSHPVPVMFKNGTENVKRKLVLNDDTNETVEITLWGKFCDNEGQVLREMFTLE